MTDVDLNALERLAEAARGGAWVIAAADAEVETFFDACTPEVVLAFIAVSREAQQLREANRKLRDLVQEMSRKVALASEPVNAADRDVAVHEAGVRDGRRDERATVVTWLRRTPAMAPCSTGGVDFIRASEIERGEHIDGAAVTSASSAASDGVPRTGAPLDIAALPDWWDEQRRASGKGPSTCAAELRLARRGDKPA